MDLFQLESFSIIGISVRTDNSDHNKLTNDMQALWGKFISENISEKIPGKIDNSIYCVYTDYDGDYTKPYLALLGCRVDNLDVVPTGLIGRKIDAAAYKKFVAKGNILHGVVFKQWQDIWNLDKDIPRAYIADLEVYGEKSQNLEDAEVDIFVGIK